MGKSFSNGGLIQVRLPTSHFSTPIKHTVLLGASKFFRYLKFLAESTSKSKTRERSFMVQDAWENKYGYRYEHGHAQGASGQHRDRDRTAAIEELKSLSSMKQHRDGLAY